MTQLQKRLPKSSLLYQPHLVVSGYQTAFVIQDIHHNLANQHNTLLIPQDQDLDRNVQGRATGHILIEVSVSHRKAHLITFFVTTIRGRVVHYPTVTAIRVSRVAPQRSPPPTTPTESSNVLTSKSIV